MESKIFLFLIYFLKIYFCKKISAINNSRFIIPSDEGQFFSATVRHSILLFEKIKINNL